MSEYGNIYRALIDGMERNMNAIHELKKQQDAMKQVLVGVVTSWLEKHDPYRLARCIESRGTEHPRFKCFPVGTTPDNPYGTIISCYMLVGFKYSQDWDFSNMEPEYWVLEDGSIYHIPSADVVDRPQPIYEAFTIPVEKLEK